MCDMSRIERRAYRDQDPPRIRNKSTEDLLRNEFQTSSRSTPNSPTALQRVASLEKCYSDPDFSKKQKNPTIKIADIDPSRNDNPSASSSREDNLSADQCDKIGSRNAWNSEDFAKELAAKVPSSKILKEVVFNGTTTNESDSCTSGTSKVTNGKDMAPVLGVPPPPPAPHMGPDGLILPRKPNNPYIGSMNHKDLHRELLFNQRVGKNILNQKSELQRALEKQREAASRKEAERIREESFKDDPRTALQRAIEQRARHIQLKEQPESMEPPNPLVTARAKLRTRTESQ
ncbi:uncharacterized protein LOC124181529 [Neodiprion fabricii]|uniref:uncharacterized protein LOC124181529 n=1 Tax=Neodiprion fabricii TaxID=2872261 RepID=UPI001ED96F1C|nr:uncharacterized protein LOC124181529 [Neodiprion fabricii]